MASENEKETQAWQSSQIKHGAFTLNALPMRNRHVPPVIPPLPKLGEALERLKALHGNLEKQRDEYLDSLSALTAEANRVKEKEEEAQEGLNQAGLSYQFAKVELDSRQTSVANTAVGTPTGSMTPSAVH